MLPWQLASLADPPQGGHRVRTALVFVLTKQNRNSIAALAGALDVAPGMESIIPLFFWDTDKLPPQVAQAAQDHDQVVVAYSFATASAERVQSSVQRVRRALVNSTTPFLLVAGGPHATGDPEGTLALGFDVAARGEGEETLPALLRAWASDTSLSEVRGLAFAGGEEIRLTPRAHRVEIDHYPPFSVPHGRWGFVEISRGCPWGCRYCQTTYVMGARMRHRSVAHIAEAMRDAMRVGFSYARFITPNALAYGSEDGRSVNLDAVEELLRETSRLVGIDQTYLGSFPSEVRPESVTPEALALITRYTANRIITIGAQSGSQRMLDQMHRGHTVAAIHASVDLALAAGLIPSVDVIFGLPGEAADDRQATIEMVREIADRGARIHGHTFMPLPGTPWAQEPPGEVTPDVESLLGELGRRGQHQGSWGRQQRIASRTQARPKNGA
jgi:B12-binding domain/radical SAM domain protein